MSSKIVKIEGLSEENETKFNICRLIYDLVLRLILEIL